MSKINPAQTSTASDPEFSEVYWGHLIEIRTDSETRRFLAWIDGQPLKSPKGWLSNAMYLPTLKTLARQRIRERSNPNP